jgi:glycine/D-amino acid oxidase-like deaminating enzyme
MYNGAVLICGIGIAGATLAYWLSENGFEPTLIERASGLHSVVRKLLFDSEQQFHRFLGYAAAAFDVKGYRPARRRHLCLLCDARKTGGAVRTAR